MEVRTLFDYRANIEAMAEAAKDNVSIAQGLFFKHVEAVGDFNLAVLNVGAALYGRVLGCEEAITRDEETQHPHVKAVISAVRAEKGDKVLRAPFVG